ncbi:MAG: hypothetical protein ACT6FF_02635 [Methanosarcinaceae archaeon]
MMLRIICFCLYVFGVRRTEISKVVELPDNTVRTMLKTISRDGFEAFFDRRKKEANRFCVQPGKPVKRKDVQITEHQDNYQISINGLDVSISKKNKHQLKAMLLTFAENGLISKTHAGKLLDISSAHVGLLIKMMSKNDLLCLIDKRKGQQQDYVFTPGVKSGLILQYTSNAVLGKPTSGTALATDLKERAQIDLSGRSVRTHISKLGLKGIDEKLRQLVKKNSGGKLKMY